MLGITIKAVLKSKEKGVQSCVSESQALSRAASPGAPGEARGTQHTQGHVFLQPFRIVRVYTHYPFDLHLTCLGQAEHVFIYPD